MADPLLVVIAGAMKCAWEPRMQQHPHDRSCATEGCCLDRAQYVVNALEAAGWAISHPVRTQAGRSELPGAAMTQPSTPVHTFTEWRYRGMGESDRLCLTCDYLQNGHEPDDEVPPCRNAGSAQSVCHRCGLVLTDGLHRTGHRECTR